MGWSDEWNWQCWIRRFEQSVSLDWKWEEVRRREIDPSTLIRRIKEKGTWDWEAVEGIWNLKRIGNLRNLGKAERRYLKRIWSEA